MKIPISLSLFVEEGNGENRRSHRTVSVIVISIKSVHHSHMNRTTKKAHSIDKAFTIKLITNERIRNLPRDNHTFKTAADVRV